MYVYVVCHTLAKQSHQDYIHHQEEAKPESRISLGKVKVVEFLQILVLKLAHHLGQYNISS